MTDTANLGMPFIDGSQAQKHVTHNEALRILDAAIQIGVLDTVLTSPPASPVEGERHIVASVATGAWSGQAKSIATFEDGTWRFLAPKLGWCAWSDADSALLVYDGAAWIDVATGGVSTLDSLAKLGINDTASGPNLLTVKSNAALFNAIDVADGGTGDTRLQISKEDGAHTASVVFSNAFSGRAEFGLVASDAFQLKVSNDGSTFVQAFVIDQTSGNLTLSRGIALTGVISPSQITSNQNDYGPTGYAVASVIQVSSDTSRSLSGLAGGAEGRVISILNVGSQTVTLLDESASSTAANRFTLGGDLAIAAKQAAILRYDATALRWYAIARSGSGGSAGALLAANNLSDVANKATGRTNLGVAIGSNVQAWDADLDAVAALAANGILTRIGAGTAAARTLTAPAAGVAITNGDGVSGNPTLALANDLAALEGLSSTGIARRTGTDAWSVGTAVANSELATMANNTFKGNVSGSTAGPADLTATQATAALNAAIGDSGSGGTKGLVPAPGSGDSAAGKFLKADMTYAVPPGTGGGGGGSYPDVNRQNALLAGIYQSKSFAEYRRGILEFYTGFKGASDSLNGIAAGSSSNYVVTPGTAGAATGYVAPNTSGGTISGATGTNIGNMTGSGGLSSAFDGTTIQTNSAGATGGGATSPYAGKTWSSAKKISQVQVWGSSDQGYTNGVASTTITLYGKQGTAPSSGTNGTSIGSVTFTDGVITDTKTIASTDQTTLWDHNWVTISPDGVNSFFAEVQFSEPGTSNNMTLVTAAQTADATVSNGRVLLEYDNTATPTLNTDLTVEVTCNGGTNWTAASLSAVTSYSQAGRKVVESVDQACTGGTSFAARIKSLNAKNVPIYGVSLTVH